jgi:hypothetical protein
MLITLTEGRMGQIALAVLKQAIAEAQPSTTPMSESQATELIEEIKNIYGEIPIEFDISFGEILSFFRELLRDQDKGIFDEVSYKYLGPVTVPV